MGVFASNSSQPDVDWESLEGELLKVMKNPHHDDGTLGPILIRLAWHSSGTYDAKTRTGGSNGATMRHAIEGGDDENKGLDKARAFLEPVKKKYPNVSYADLWIFAAYVFLEASGGPKIVFKPGRVDKGPEHQIKPKTWGSFGRDTRLPGAETGTWAGVDKDGRPNGWQRNAHHIREVFYKMGINDQELTALLCGGHVYGRCHTENSGYNGPWVVEPWKFSNEYAEDMINDEWKIATHEHIPEGTEQPEEVRPSKGFRQFVGFPADEDEEEDDIPIKDISAYPPGQYVVDTTWINCREKPDVTSPILGRPENGETFSIVAMTANAGLSVRGRLAIGGWVSIRGSGGKDLLKRTGDLNLPTGKYRIYSWENVPFYELGQQGFQLARQVDFRRAQVVSITETRNAGKETYGQLEGGRNWIRLVAPGQFPYYERIQAGWNDQPRSIRMKDVKTQMMLVSDMVLAWDPGFRKYLEIYAAEEGGEEKLREDFGKAFKKLTELGFSQFPNAIPIQKCPFQGPPRGVSQCPVMGH